MAARGINVAVIVCTKRYSRWDGQKGELITALSAPVSPARRGVSVV